jgi:hypothetical protein
MTGKSGKREILWEKIRKRKKWGEKNTSICHARPFPSLTISSYHWPSHYLVLLCKLCAMAQCSSHITLYALQSNDRPCHTLARGALSEIGHNVCGISASQPSGTMRFP